MRKLHLVGLTTDRDGLIFTARKGSKSGGYIVPLDQKVLDAIAAASGQDDGEPEEVASMSDVEVVPKRLRSESALTPREMQARLRAGRTIDEVAAEAGVDTEWVARFAVPILAEQAQVVELARGLVYAKPRLGESTEPLGASVLQNLSDRGVFLADDVAHSGWSAFQLHDSVWMVRFRYRSRGRDQEAHWEIDVPTGRLRARNRQASDLGYVGPDRWRGPEDELEEPPAEGEAPPAPAPSTRRRATPPPAPAPKAASRPAAKARTTGRRAPTPAVKKAAGRPAKRTAGRKAKAPPAVIEAATRPAKGTAARNVKAAPPVKKAAKRTPARSPKAATAANKAGGRPAKRTAARNVKEAPPVKKAVTRKAGAVTRKTPAKGAARPATAKSATRRRPTKAVPAPEAGPAVGSGGVRMAVAQVSTARVAASMATADREPWAAAVRRLSRAGAGAPAGNSGRRPTVKQAAARDRGTDVQETVRPFQPRPLPAPGSEPPERRIRKVTLPRPRVTGDGDAPPALSLPASRRQSQATEAVPVVEKAKRRRLRSR